jgi:hypothetical protein
MLKVLQWENRDIEGNGTFELGDLAAFGLLAKTGANQFGVGKGQGLASTLAPHPAWEVVPDTVARG